MSEEGRESEETVDVDVDDVSVEETETETENDDSDNDVSGNTNDSINASLDSIKDADVLKGMVTRLRHENGNHRRKNKELEVEVEKLKGWKLNHNKGVAEAQERATKAEAIAKQHVIKSAALEYGVDDDLIDLIDGNSEEEIWAKAEKLANTKKQRASYETPTNIDLFAGRSRGKPLAPKSEKDPGVDFFKDFISGR